MRTAAVVAFCIVAAFVAADVSAASTAKPGAAVVSPGKATAAAGPAGTAGTLSTPLAKPASRPASVAADPKATATPGGEACPTQCPYSYQPLCGKSTTGNTRTFSNQCDLKKYNCTYPNKYEFMKEGKC